MPPAARGCRPLDPCPGEMISPGPLGAAARFSDEAALRLKTARRHRGRQEFPLLKVKERKGRSGELPPERKEPRRPKRRLPRLGKSLEGGGWGLGKREGSFSSEKFPPPSPSSRYLLNTLPMPRMPASSKSLPMSCMPTGRPSASPTGNERPGSPARFRDTV